MSNQKDYQDFINSSPASVPPELSSKILNKIKSLLNPKWELVFGKILILHAIVGTLSLSICHQFGINPFKTYHSLDQWFMSFTSHNLCMAFCGMFFISLTLLASSFILTKEEYLVFKKNQLLQTSSLALFSLTVFFFMGAYMSLIIAIYWFIGAILGGFLSTNIGLRIFQTQ